MPEKKRQSQNDLPKLGQGTWNIGDHPSKRQAEIKALQLGIDLGMTLIDTAEMYGSGASEVLVGEAIKDRRHDVIIVTKVLPSNATLRGTIKACERSLRHLKTDYIDIYLLHWRGSVPLAETLEAFQTLKQSGKIKHYGVSNFDLSDIEEAIGLPGGNDIVTNQVLYNLQSRGIEWQLLPWCRKKNISIMAYTPFGRENMLKNAKLQSIALRHSATPAQIALAWVMREEGVIAIPKAANEQHVRDNHAALNLHLTPADLKEIDSVFPPPKKNVPLDVV